MIKKKEIIYLVFRIAAVFIVLYDIGFAPIYMIKMGQISTAGNTPAAFSAFLVIACPLIFAYLLWNKREWFAEKVLSAIYLQDESEIPGINEPSALEDAPFFSVEEILSIALTILGIWIAISSIADLVQYFLLLQIEQAESFYYLSFFIGAALRVIFGLWLIFGSARLVSVFQRWKDQRNEM